MQLKCKDNLGENFKEILFTTNLLEFSFFEVKSDCHSFVQGLSPQKSQTV